MTQHTPGKLRIDEYGGIVTPDGEKLELTGVSMPCGHVPKDAECHANARRLVACWNACEGIETDELEKIRLDDLPVLCAVPELQSAMEALAEFWRNGTPVHPGSEVANDALAAIAAARGEVTA